MILDLRDIFAGGNDIPLDVSIDTDFGSSENASSAADSVSSSAFDVNGQNPVSELRFCGTVTNRADVIHLDGKASYTYSAPCDRCAEPVSKQFSLDVSHILVNELSNAEDYDDNDIIITENMQLDLDELICSDVLLNMPVKFLCKPDCKGICPICKKRLNFESCICEKEIDPRLAKLSAFFDEDE